MNAEHRMIPVVLVTILALVLVCSHRQLAAGSSAVPPPASAAAAGYAARDFSALLGTPGFSDTLLKNHFALYQGYVANVNKLRDSQLALLRDGKAATPEFAELTRRFGWEFDGMRMHELYFENLGPRPLASHDGPLATQIASQFGSFAAWEQEFRALGAMRGIGWVELCQDPTDGRLHDVWINEHDTGQLVGCRPLLVMDVFEHAYFTDYGPKRADYVDAFFKAIDWPVVEARLK